MTMLWLVSVLLSNAQPAPFTVEFSVEGGFFDAPVHLRLEAPAGSRIYFTTDGSRPGRRARLYREPIVLPATTVVRAVAYRGRERSAESGHTFFINEPPTTFPVFSIAIPPRDLFDPEEGLFVPGSEVLDTSWKKSDANFWSRKEVIARVEIFETDSSLVFNSLTGFRLFGGMSRLFPQKSMALVARERYGEDRFHYPIFGREGPDKFRFFVLRNSGSDFGRSHFRDALMTGLVRHWDLETQAYRPAIVYINGRYWGVYNIREKVNKYFLNEYFDIDKDSIDLIEHRLTLKEGDKRHYKRLLHYLETHDMSIPSHYAAVGGMMEIDNFIDLQVAQIYFDNQDAGGNIKFWRPQTRHGRWRWILYDTDWGFGLHDSLAFRNNSLAFHTRPDGPSWPNPPWSTFILRKLLENPDFQAAFVNRFADHLNESFRPERVLAHIEEKYTTLLPEMPRHFQRWRLSPEEWVAQVERMRTFAQRRPAYVRRFLSERFPTGPQRTLRAEATPGGRILINRNLEIGAEEWEGIYFADIPIRIRAIPNYGYRFSHWEGIDMPPQVREFSLTLDAPEQHIRAVFEPYVHPLAGRLLINEIGPIDKGAGDWLELINYSDQPVNLRNWIITDLKHRYRLPDASIGANDYLIICEDEAAFRQAYPRAYQVLGKLPFGLNKRRETIALYDPMGAMVDSISYTLFPTDSMFTLSLLLPHLDNSDQENWTMRTGPGTPNAPNPFYVTSQIKSRQAAWMRLGMAAGLLLICLLLLGLRRHGRI